MLRSALQQPLQRSPASQQRRYAQRSLLLDTGLHYVHWDPSTYLNGHTNLPSNWSTMSGWQYFHLAQ